MKHGENDTIKIDFLFPTINDTIFDNKDNIYFATNKGLYKLKNNNIIEKEVLNINFRIIAFSKNYKGYIYVTSGAMRKKDFVLFDNNKIKKIDNIKGYVYNIFVDSKDNVYM